MTLSESRSVVSAPQTSGDGIKSRTAVNCQSRQTDFMLRYAFAFPVQSGRSTASAGEMT